MPPSEERKLVTVLFADLVGSTELAVRQDPEQLRALLSAFFEEMAQQIRAFGGVVEKYAGDADHGRLRRAASPRGRRGAGGAGSRRHARKPRPAEPHVRAGVRRRLELRVGIATGEAVAVTEPDPRVHGHGRGRQSRGAAPVRRSRDRHVPRRRFRLVRPLVETEATAPLTLKGFPAPIIAHLVTGSATPPSTRGSSRALVTARGPRPRADRSSIAAPTELARGRGRSSPSPGRRGSGSRASRTSFASHPPPRVRWLEGRCQAFTQHSSYAPLVQILRAVFQLTGAEAPPVARTKLSVTLRSLVGEQVRAGAPRRGPPSRDRGRAWTAACPPAMDPRAFQSQLVLALRSIIEALGPARAAHPDRRGSALGRRRPPSRS